MTRRWPVGPRWLLVAMAVLAALPAAALALSGGDGRAAAVHAALRAFEAQRHAGPEIVFGVSEPLPAGTVVGEAGARQAASGGRATRSQARVITRLRAPAWLFYEDLAPYQQYTHPGRVALVDARTGRVTLLARLSWPPSVGGALPAFLASQAAYDSGHYRVLYRPYTSRAKRAAAEAGAAGRIPLAARAVSDAFRPSGASAVARLLAAQRSCAVRVSDTVPGGFYAFAQIAQSRAALGYRFGQFSALANGFRSVLVTSPTPATPLAAAERAISSGGCKDVLVYVAGGGYPGAGTTNVGLGLSRTGLVQQNVVRDALTQLVRAHRSVHFEFVFDAPQSAVFHALAGLANVLLVATPVAPGGGSFTYLPDVSLDGRPVENISNPRHLLQLTDRLAFGMSEVVDDPAETAWMQSQYRAGRLPSALAYLLARSFARGGAVDFVAQTGVGSPPWVQIRGFSAGGPPPPGPMPQPQPKPQPQPQPTVSANPDGYAAANDGTLSVAAAHGVLANDHDSAGNPLTVDALNGAAGTPPLHGTSSRGAAVTVSADGSLSYDPAGSASLQALTRGQTATDTFTYRAADGHGATSTATVTVTVTGANRAPVLSGIETGALPYAAGTPAVRVTSTLAVSDPDDSDLAGATVRIASGFVAGEDVLGFTDANGITGSYAPTTGILTLTGAASVASYQAALRSVTYRDPNGASPTTGGRTVSFAVDDGHGAHSASNTETRQVSVGANAAPVAASDRAATDKATTVSIDVLGNDTDAEGESLHVDPASIDTTGTKGSVSLNPDGTVRYDPNGQFNSLQQGQSDTDTFTYRASDGFHDSSPATVTVTVAGVNDPPVLANIETAPLQTDAGAAPVRVTATLTASAPSGVTTLAGATVTVANGFRSGEDVLAFTPGNNITGSYDASAGVLKLTGVSSVGNYQAALRSVTFADTNGATLATGPRTVAFEVDDGRTSHNLSNDVSRTVQVNPNPPPTANPDTASTGKHTAIDLTVLANDSDPNNLPLDVASLDTTGTRGSVSINPDGKTIHYDPNGQFEGLTQGQIATDTFTYRASNGFHDSNPATVTVTITGVNDSPVLANIETSSLAYRAQDPAVPITSTLTVNDADDNTVSSATVSVTSGFNPVASDMLGFTNANGITGSYDLGTGTLTLTGNATLADYQAALRSVTFSTSDGSATPASRTVSFAVTDSLGAPSNAASRGIDVAAANQPPVAGADSYSAVGNTPLGVGTGPAGPAVTTSGSVLANDSDPDSSSPLTVTGNTPPGHGTVSMNPDGTFTYVPNAGYSGADSFQYTVTDGDDPANPQSATGTVTITVGPVVWYVDDSKTSAGDGRAMSPFNTLAAAGTASAQNSIVFLYQGSTAYGDGIALKPGQSLFGQPHGLTAGGHVLVPAGGGAPVIHNASGDAIDLAENADVEAITIANPAQHAIAASNVNDASVGISNAVTVDAGGGDGVHITGGSGILRFGTGAISSSGGGHSVSVSGRQGGAVSFAGPITDGGTGIALTGNAGASITFSGTIGANPISGIPFSATGGGTVAATGPGSVLVSNGARALDVAGTTIGAGGLNFQTIDAFGGDRGISLVNTGTAGGLTVTGTGAANSGGEIGGTTATGAALPNPGDGAIYLSGTGPVSLTGMYVHGNRGSGIYGTGVHGLTLSASSIAGNGTADTAKNLNTYDVRLDSLSGTGAITNTTVSGSPESGAVIAADPVTGASVTVTGSTFSGNFSDGLLVKPAASGAGPVTFVGTGNTLSSNKGTGINFASSPASTAPGRFTIANNTATGQQGNAINVVNLGSGTWTGHVTGNAVGTSGVANSGSTAGDGVNVRQGSSGTMTVDVRNNTVREIEQGYGISATGDGTSTLNLTLTGNNVDTQNTTTALDGMTVDSGTGPADTSTVCLSASGNTSTSEDAGAFGGLGAVGLSVVNQEPSSNFAIAGLPGSATTDDAVANYLAGTNTLSGPGSPNGAVAQHNTKFFTSAASCPTPPAGP